jgi:MFS transporter, CP family, cyanate transporter
MKATRGFVFMSLQKKPYTVWNRESQLKHAGILAVTLFFVSMTLRPAITSLSPLLDTIAEALHMSGSMVSLLTAIPVFCMGIFAPLAAKFGARFGVERTLTWCIILIGASIGFRVIAIHPFALLATAVFSGIGMAVAGPLISAFIKRHFPMRSAALLGIYTAGMGIGSTISASLVVPAAHEFGSWSGALSIWSLLTLLALIFWIPFVEIRLPRGALRPASACKSQLPWKNKRAWLHMVIFGLQSGVYYAVATWLAPLASEFGIGPVVAGDIVGLCSIIQMATSFIVPVFVQKTGEVKKWMLACSVSLLLGFMLIVFIPSSASLWIGTILIALGTGPLFPLILLLPILESSSPQFVNDWTSFMLFGGYLFSSFFPILVGSMHDFLGTYQSGFISLLVVSFLLVLTVLRLKK